MTITPTFQSGQQWKCTEEVAHQLLDKFAEVGGNFIDTADVYSQGKSEQIVGNWLSR